ERAAGLGPAAPAALGWLPGAARRLRVLAGPPVAAARPPRLPSRWPAGLAHRPPCTLMSTDCPRPPDFDDTDFRRTLGRFPTGVTIVTTRAPDGRPVGLTVSSFNSVSLQPPLVLWSLAHRSHALAVFEQAPRYAIHVLAAGQAALARQFALPGERFANVDWAFNDQGVPILREGCAARLECC